MGSIKKINNVVEVRYSLDELLDQTVQVRGRSVTLKEFLCHSAQERLQGKVNVSFERYMVSRENDQVIVRLLIGGDREK